MASCSDTLMLNVPPSDIIAFCILVLVICWLMAQFTTAITLAFTIQFANFALHMLALLHTLDTVSAAVAFCSAIAAIRSCILSSSVPLTFSSCSSSTNWSRRAVSKYCPKLHVLASHLNTAIKSAVLSLAPWARLKFLKCSAISTDQGR